MPAEQGCFTRLKVRNEIYLRGEMVWRCSEGQVECVRVCMTILTHMRGCHLIAVTPCLARAWEGENYVYASIQLCKPQHTSHIFMTTITGTPARKKS
eukprot:1139140-Pelagomonas_calceolata.AAC.9